MARERSEDAPQADAGGEIDVGGRAGRAERGTVGAHAPRSTCRCARAIALREDAQREPRIVGGCGGRERLRCADARIGGERREVKAMDREGREERGLGLAPAAARSARSNAKVAAACSPASAWAAARAPSISAA